MIVVAHDTAEGRMGKAAELPGVCLAPIEESVAEAMPTVRLQQHGFAAVENLLQIEARFFKRFGELVGVLDHRRRGRGADNRIAVARYDANGARCGGKLGEVGLFVLECAVVEIRPVAENDHAQPRQSRQHRADLLAGQRFHVQRHGEPRAGYSTVGLSVMRSILLEAPSTTMRGLCVLASSVSTAAYEQIMIRSPRQALRAAAPLRPMTPLPARPSMT